MVSNDKKDMDNDYFMHLYIKNHQWNNWYVYESIFGQVTHPLMLKYRPLITT